MPDLLRFLKEIFDRIARDEAGDASLRGRAGFDHFNPGRPLHRARVLRRRFDLIRGHPFGDGDETQRDLCFWNLTVVHTNTGERIKLERFSSRVEADLRRAELQELLASAHCTSRLVTIITQEGTRPSCPKTGD